MPTARTLDDRTANFWTFGRRKNFPKVQKSNSFGQLFLAKGAEKRRLKRLQVSRVWKYFWIELLGPPGAR
jgi:hypothetical protein